MFIPLNSWRLKDILFFDFSSNLLDGPLSLDIENLKVVVEINLAKHKIFSDIPTVIGGLKDLYFIDLAFNRLEGPIPELFGDFKSLEILNLSNNNISRSIPTWSNYYTSKRINFSFNKLEEQWINMVMVT